MAIWGPILQGLDWIGRIQVAYWIWSFIGGTAALTAVLAVFHGSALYAFLAFLAGFAIVLGIIVLVVGAGVSTTLPRRRLVIVPQRQRTFWWHMGSMGDQPVMQIVGDFYLTNHDGVESFIAKTYVVIYYLKWKSIPLRKKADGHAHYRIPPLATIEARANFYITPAFKQVGAPLYGKVCFVDQHGESHWSSPLKWEHDSKLATQL